MTRLSNGAGRYMNNKRLRRRWVLGCPHRSPTRGGLVTSPPGRDQVGRHHWPPTGHWRQVAQSVVQHSPPFDTPGPASSRSRRRTSSERPSQAHHGVAEAHDNHVHTIPGGSDTSRFSGRAAGCSVLRERCCAFPGVRPGAWGSEKNTRTALVSIYKRYAIIATGYL